jgi:hypothetical protein
MRLLLVGVVLAATGPGCVIKNLPAPARPDRTVPVLAMPPPPANPGQGQVAIESIDGPATVEAVLADERWSGTYVSGTATRTAPVCVAPCVANLPFGQHKLRVVDVANPHLSGTETITVGASPSVYRVKLGDNSRYMGRAVLGMFLDIYGGTTGLIGLAMMTSSSSSDIGSGLFVTGAIALGIGLIVGRHSLVGQPSAGTQWVPADGVIHATR